MISLQNVHELEKIFRNELAKQSLLPKNKVLNALSIRGQDLTKYISTNEIEAIDNADSLMLFELKSINNSQNNVQIEEESSGELIRYCEYEIKVIVYGYNSSNIVNSLISRFNSQYIIDKLYQVGALIIDISDSYSLNEIINETTWRRTDFSISVGCKISTTQVEEYEDYGYMSNLNIHTI